MTNHANKSNTKINQLSITFLGTLNKGKTRQKIKSGQNKTNKETNEIS